MSFNGAGIGAHTPSTINDAPPLIVTVVAVEVTSVRNLRFAFTGIDAGNATATMLHGRYDTRLMLKSPLLKLTLIVASFVSS